MTLMMRQRKKRKEHRKKVIKRDPRPHVNLVFIGHVDAGKSTISGHLLYLTGMVDERTMEKFERDAKAQNRESWKFAWCMDLTEAERAKGKTHETGSGYFETKDRRYTILDAPGHKAFVPSMIGGACQADLGILVISARKGEFETGFEKGGQTREHAILAKTAGIRHLVVLINKMDDPTVEWSKTRYDEIVDKLTPFLKGTGYQKTAYQFIPASGLGGFNLAEKVSSDLCPWYSGPPLLEILNALPVPEASEDEPLRFPIQGKYRDMGLVVHGKCESGSFEKDAKLLLLPTKLTVVIDSIQHEGIEVDKCFPTDNVQLRLKGIEEEELRVGYVLAKPKQSLPISTLFTAQILVLECKNIITTGYGCLLHIHAVAEECSFQRLLCILDKKTGEVLQKNPKFAKPGETVLARIEVSVPIVVEMFKSFSKFGRFIMRDEGKTIAVGVVTKVFTGEAATEE